MRIRSILLLVLGSVVVHLGASCAVQKFEEAQSGPDASGPVDAIVDVLRDTELVRDVVEAIDTVKPAEAGPTDPKYTVDDIACDKTHTTTGGGKVLYGEKEYPGRSKADLSRAGIVVCTPGLGAAPPGYACYSNPIFVRDGAIAVTCGTGTTSITITLPPAL